jgi:hypothetical protein
MKTAQLTKISMALVIGALLFGCGEKSDPKLDAFLKAHGFQSKAELIQYQKASPEEKAKISARNAANNIPLEKAMNCAISTGLGATYLKQNGQLDERTANILINSWMNVLEAINAKNKVDEATASAKLKEAMAPRVAAFNESAESRQKDIDQLKPCSDEVTPYFAAKDIDAYQVK